MRDQKSTAVDDCQPPHQSENPHDRTTLARLTAVMRDFAAARMRYLFLKNDETATAAKQSEARSQLERAGRALQDFIQAGLREGLIDRA